MIAVDTNILVYAHRADSPWHTRAERDVGSLAESSAAWAIAWPCIHEFYGIVTHQRIYGPPTLVDLAIDQIEAWLAAPGLRLLSESPVYWKSLRKLIADASTNGPRIHDARIAALCLDNGVAELWSTDRDFSRFPALKTSNPLID
jgi:uncharacterized protein